MAGNIGPTNEELLKIFRSAELIRQTDERLRNLISQGKLSANYYSPRGQEIVSTAMAIHLRQDDYCTTIYRGLHDHLAKGVPLKTLLAEYFGKADGSCKGKGGCMHITHPESGVMITTGIVGSGMPIANGLAWASKLRGDGKVTVSNFGDGASNIGAFHEAMNLAALWKLPVVFLCQNNLYAEHTATENCTAGRIVDRALGYGMPGVQVDGNDVLEMYEAAREAVERARAGQGPSLIEARTFRFFGHNFGDPANYIPKDQMEAAKAADPLPRLRKVMLERGAADEAKLAAIVAEVTAQLEEAITFAQDAPYPDPAEVLIDVYAKPMEAA